MADLNVSMVRRPKRWIAWCMPLAVRGLVNIRMDTRENELRALPSTKGGIPNKIPSAWMRRI